jgi:2-dehydro-3-deoxygluconokinase
MAQKIVCFGELLLRLTAPGHERFLQSAHFDVAVGGAEANVAVALAGFGNTVSMVSVVSDNPLGDAAIGELRRHRVDTSAILRTPGRMGLYFLEQGAVRRPSRIIYDRAGSAFANLFPSELDWPRLLDGTGLLHISGVTPAIGQNAADAAIAAARAAKKRGVTVSFDGNYRAQLWAAWPGDGPGILKAILECATVAFINERDLALILGREFASRADAYATAFSAFPDLKMIAATTRQQSSVGDQIFAAEAVTRERRCVSPEHALSGVVDRIGSGDAFAAGALHGFLAGYDLQHLIDFAAASGALKHSMHGDFLRASLDDVEATIAGGSLDVRR